MEKTVKIRLFNSVVGTGFAYGKGENDLPESLARDFVASGLGEYVVEPPKIATKPHERAENAASQQAKKAEKR